MNLSNRFLYIIPFLCLIFLFSNCNKEETDPETCSDGVMNQDETGIDCGGVCNVICPTCDDGIQNQGEPGIDCGGPCPMDCFFTPPCDFQNNAAYLNITFSNISCNSANNRITGTGLNGNITIEFGAFPTESSVVNIGGSNSIKIDDFVGDELLTATSGKMYIEFFDGDFILTFCNVSFSAPSGGKVTSGRVTCL